VFICVCLCVCMFVCVCVYVSMCVYMCVCMCLHHVAMRETGSSVGGFHITLRREGEGGGEGGGLADRRTTCVSREKREYLQPALKQCLAN
jgi:hypothetical protein